MKIDFISDLHVNFWVSEINPQSPKMNRQMDQYIGILQLGINDAECLIIAGDLGHYFPQDSTFLLKCKELYKYVLIVPGNHDLYLETKNQEKRYLNNSLNRKAEMKRFCRDNDIVYLDGQIVCIDGIKFWGSGLSWDTSLYKEFNESASNEEINKRFLDYMNDGRLIFMDGKKHYRIPLAYNGYDFVSSFNPFKYFEEEYSKLEKLNEKVDIIITHYGPVVPDNIPEEYRIKESSFYYFDGKKDIERINPKYWIFGHTHIGCDFMYKNTNLLCNPLGYPSENTYVSVKTIEII